MKWEIASIVAGAGAVLLVTWLMEGQADWAAAAVVVVAFLVVGAVQWWWGRRKAGPAPGA